MSGQVQIGGDGVCQVCVIHGNGVDAGKQWSVPCQQPHPLLLKHLDIANIPHWQKMIEEVGTGNIQRALVPLQNLDVAVNQSELDAGKNLQFVMIQASNH